MRSVFFIFIVLLIHKAGLSETLTFKNESFGLYTYSDLSKIKSVAPNERDESVLLARKAEQLFHEILNDYRAKLGKSKLEWVDLHWVAAYNHNNWMAENEQLAHYQSRDTPFFSGASPRDRVRFANDQDFSMNYSGENCLYNWVRYSSGSLDEKALKLAQKLFRQWKISPGHYANMLNDTHQGHAVAFYIETSGKVWGTSMFGSYQNTKTTLREVRRNDAVRYAASGVKENTLLIRGAKSEKFDKAIYLSSANIDKYLNEELTVYEKSASKKKRNYMVKAAMKHAEYLSKYQTFGELQNKRRKLFYGERTKDRLNKASFFWTMLTGKANKAKSASTTISFVDKIVSLESIIDEVKQVLAESFKDNYKLYGYGIKVCKKRGVHFITVVKIVV